ncbi:MAG: hypothetical protein EXR55_05085 [Dehalococcoidia bacterium]|nr:hypothetical protein [Dehalococcoidia bacterium]
MLAGIVAWLHVVAVVVGIGGSAFVLFVLRPLALRTLEPPVAMRLMGAVQARFRWVIWGAILTFIVTGLWTAVAFRGMTSLDALFTTAFGRTLVVKSLLALLLFAGAFSVTLPVPWLAWFRQRQFYIMRMNLVLAAIIVLLATLLVRRGGVF